MLHWVKPLAWSALRHDQAKSLDENHLRLDELNSVAAGIGVDSVSTKKGWAYSMDIKNTGLLFEFWPYEEFAKCYGIFREEDSFFRRANNIVAEYQKIILSMFTHHRNYLTSKL